MTSRESTATSTEALPFTRIQKCGPHGPSSEAGIKTSPGARSMRSACKATARAVTSSLKTPIGSALMGRPRSTCSPRLSTIRSSRSRTDSAPGATSAACSA
eukprot:CAMPEP_0171142602 /NCGR_PEP_ID=MMETSP0766_2-20121228/142830_1 /TAXON_ID=439317 /ORGANISM="Gambierdiscus australes, Strain CAWD 149" /LENGTH=100 /DNA_ID=CAMNT_0011606399 /DNA_START=890 /DNA_END=1188 /DNA_ORIENTATION=+